MEITILETLADLGVTAVVVGLTIYAFYKLHINQLNAHREDTRTMLVEHREEREKWQESDEKKVLATTEAMEKQAEATTLAIDKIVKEIRNSR